MIDNKLRSIEVIGQDIAEITDMIKTIELRLETIKAAVDTVIGNPLSLSYGHSQSLGNGQAYKTEIVMSRECTLSEALFVLPHSYGIDPKNICVNGRKMGEGYNSKVKSIAVIESWGSKEYVITVDKEERESK
jgi:hypothetical protein